MPTGKRASMREGPLAALFRKTAEDTGQPGAGVGAAERVEGDQPAPALPAADSRALPAARVPPRQLAEKSEQPLPDEASEEHRVPSLPERTRREERRSASPPERARREEHRPPSPPERARREEHRVPSPQERLRQAFSPDIPDVVLTRSAPPEPEPEPEPDVYAVPERTGQAFAAGRPVGTPVLRVVGVGGAGVNAVNRMVEAEVEGVEFLAINTDLQSLQQSAAHETLHIGDSITRGLGSGSDPELGRQAARSEYDRIKSMLRGSDMVFIAAGAGGGTGTGAAPVVAQIARELGALTVGIVTRPFQFEGSRRKIQAEQGIEALAVEVDTLIVVPNNRLLSVLDRNTSMVEAFRVADDVLRQGVQGICDLVTLPGLINLDFADVRTIMHEAGNALLGIGMGSGERRAIDAAERAVASPLLETSMEGARSILLSITGGRDLSLWEVNESAKAVAEAAHPDANIIFGAMVDERLEDQVWVTVVATGYGNGHPRRRMVRESAGLQPRGAAREPGAIREPSGTLREPPGEPRVSRVRRRESSQADLDVPEFIPRR